MTKIRDLIVGQKDVEVIATVVLKKAPRTVNSAKGLLVVTDLYIEDATGRINLPLFGNKADGIEVGDVIRIQKGFVKEYKGELQLTIKFGTIEKTTIPESRNPMPPSPEPPKTINPETGEPSEAIIKATQRYYNGMVYTQAKQIWPNLDSKVQAKIVAEMEGKVSPTITVTRKDVVGKIYNELQASRGINKRIVEYLEQLLGLEGEK